MDVFVWSAYEAPGVDPSFICHHLNVNPSVMPRKQPPQRSSKEHAEAVKEEVLKLKEAGAIKEGYHQIPLALEDQDKTTFVTPTRNYHYKKGFEWIEECATAFQQLKEYLSCPPIMSRPEVEKVLFAYIAVADHAVSLVLIWVDNNIQKPVYIVSKSLHEAEVHYLADYTSRIAKWGTILGAFDIKYMLRTSVKGQVLADLVAEFTEPSLEESAKGSHMDEKSIGMNSCKDSATWKVYVDGAANQRGSGVGLVLVSPEGLTLEKSLRLGFSATKNEAEYEALLVGMDMVQRMGGKSTQMFSNSQFVVGQVEGTLEAKDPRMQEYLTRVRYLQSKLDSFTLMHISRSGNTHADSLATLATSSTQGLPRVILVEDLLKPARTAGDVVHVHQVRLGPSWMDPIVSFLKSDILPEERSKADKVHRKAPQFWLSEDQKLYKCSFSRPYLLCIHPEATESLLEKFPWPFAQWGLDIVGPFPKAVGNERWLLVGTDYFTKWVEAKPVSNIRDVDAKKFVWKNIVTRFGIPHTLISDNGLQFDSNAFRKYCCGLGIINRYSTPAYPQGNGQVEAVNKVIIHRRDAFSMTYGTEVVIPLETGFPTLRTSSFIPGNNDDLLQKSLDLVEEQRENDMVQLAYYQHKLKRGYDAHVKLRPLAPEDLVLRKVLGTTKNPAWGKLGPTWEGSYRITTVAGASESARSLRRFSALSPCSSSLSEPIEFLSGSLSSSERLTTWPSRGLSTSSRRNWSISSSRDRREDVNSSRMAVV
ncbi:uncharacterized protein LOC142620433 [Castanea sativa]|uniref:uncharacterized protein LOC142620433 n=1 Tax=Castanea sativa TaxID=21020 RepID=UPI003F64979E